MEICQSFFHSHPKLFRGDSLWKQLPFLTVRAWQGTTTSLLASQQAKIQGSTTDDNINESFRQYYRARVSKESEISKTEFMQFPMIQAMLKDGRVFSDDLEDLWLSSVGDASSLNEEEAFELMNMIWDLPDPDDEEFLEKEFLKISGGKDSINFFQFINWDDVKDMLIEGAITMEQINSVWRKVVGGLDEKSSQSSFKVLNDEIDALLEGSEEKDTSTLNVWKSSFDPTAAFDQDVYDSLRDYFQVVCSSGKKFYFKDLMQWEDIQSLIDENAVSESDLKKIWQEASSLSEGIDFDTFLRLNVRIDLWIDEEKEKVNDVETKPISVEKDSASFYKSEFQSLSEGSGIVTIEDLLSWSEIQQLIDEKALDSTQVERIFLTLPSKTKGGKRGIDESSFVTFNGMIDSFLDSSQNAESSLANDSKSKIDINNDKSNGSTDDASNGISTEGLSPQELQMMQQLDEADNMLNSGSFGDFDQLIGDVNDPRLAALRMERDGAESITGKITDFKTELIRLCNKQGRCGIDAPEEEAAARIRDLIQAIIEQSPRIASTRSIEEIRKTLNGNWRLLYTNSQMFEFYNGVTGFANVFPLSKFVKLSVQYASDGYLSEAKYFENIGTPVGDLDCVVFANWDLVKEMSFMTNENSVVLRNYCTKVTAGPMEYQAEENWKSLRTMSMNEMVYIDDEIKIMRNCGALRIYFVYQRC